MVVRRQISDQEKVEVLLQHENRCFVDGEPFADGEAIEYHHIKAYTDDGPTSMENIAPVCKRHHRSIGTMTLQEFRDKLELAKFFKDSDPKYLDDLINHKAGTSGQDVKYEIDLDKVRLYFADDPYECPIHNCPTTGWSYFYATLPIDYIQNDKDLQPRALRESAVWGLYRHFQKNTQLAPSVGRINDGGPVMIFDGQHKAAAQIWAGRPRIECKVYLDPDPRTLKETNLEAHGPLRQMTFYSHELVAKYADIFGQDWTEYMEAEGEKSELGFFHFLVFSKGKTKAQAKNEISKAIYQEILDDSSNKLTVYLSEKHRGRKQPLTFARLQKAFFQQMLLAPPVKEEFESDNDFRQDERSNFVRLMNIIVEECLDGKWAPERNDAAHSKAERMFGAGAVRAWAILLRDAMNQHLRHYTDEERSKFFFRRIPEEDFIYFRQFVKKIFAHKIWDDPDPSGEITARLYKDDLATSRSLFEEKGLTVQYVLGS